MKKYIFLPCLTALFFWAGCRPEAIKPYESSSSFNVSALTGTWKMTNAMQSDNDAIRKGFPYKTVDILLPLKLNEMTLTLNGSGSGNFAINYGTAAKIFKITNGNWSVNDSRLPSVLTLAGVTDTTRLSFANYASMANNKLMFKTKRVANGKEMITYDFEFTKQ